MSERIIRIGGASAFWGDTATAAPQLVDAGVDYLVFDYLAEITMSILAGMRAKSPEAGYAGDFVTVTMAALVRDVAAKGIKVVSNAGGVNPRACAEAVRKVTAQAGVELKVAAVLGDDLMARAGEFRDAGVREIDSGEALPERLLSMNAYLGALPIARALAEGADVVITGRCADSAVALGPLIHEFGWAADDYDRLAAGTLAGHIIECGAQATGGIFTDWQDVPGWENIGFPIVECAADGSLIVTKPAETGGLVSPATVGEQMLYEIGDPRAYVVPDVVCDFSAVAIERAGTDRVRVAGARGRPPTGSYKISATTMDGFRCIAVFTVTGREAAARGQRVADAILARTRRMFAAANLGDYAETHVELLGTESVYGPHARALDPREVVVKIGVRHQDRKALEVFSREVAPAGTGMAAGMGGFAGGRPKVQPVIRLFSFLTAKAGVETAVETEDDRFPVEVPAGGGFDEQTLRPREKESAAIEETGETMSVPLVRLAWGRSGDKGDNANIGIIARDARYLPLLRRALSEAVVAEYFAHLVDGPVTRYEVPGIHAFNFVLEKALGGGGVASLRNDPQGKAYAQMLLDLSVQVPVSWKLAP